MLVWGQRRDSPLQECEGHLLLLIGFRRWRGGWILGPLKKPPKHEHPVPLFGGRIPESGRHEFGDAVQLVFQVMGAADVLDA